MQIKTIRASAGRTIPHPHESYSNLKIHVELTADLRKGEDADAAAVQLQGKVSELLAAECDRRIADIERKVTEERERREAEYKRQSDIRAAERAVHEAQERLDVLTGKATEEEQIPF